MPNITRGGRMAGLLVYLAGPGRSNEHSEPHLVAGDAAVMAWHDDAELNHQAALQIGWQLDQPRRAFGTRVTTAVKNREGHNVGVKDAHVWHCSLSLRADEPELSDEKWAHICEEFVAGMGFADPSSDDAPCRWVAVRHGRSKAGNDHVHVVVGLVREDGTKANVWNDRPNAQRLAGALERKYGLQVLESRDAGTGVRGQKPAEVEVVVRDELAKTVRATAAACDNEAEFVRRMRQTPDMRIRPRFAAGRDDVVTGYSVAWAAPGAGAANWYGGGSLGADLSLPKLRAAWPDTPQDAATAIPEWQAAKRNQRSAPGSATPAIAAPTTARDQLALVVRACAAAAGDEAEFVRRVRRAGLRIRPRFAKGDTTVVTGYSVALRNGPAAGIWYGGGHLARDLTLTRLRAEWPTSPADARAALGEWTAARRDAPSIAVGREAQTPDPEMWARYTTEVTALREQLRSVPCEDRELWAHVARETAGAFAAWSHSVEGGAAGPIAETARVLARSAQLRAHQVRPRPAGLPSARGAALLCASIATGGSGTVAQTVLLRQLANTVKALHDAHQAAGDLRRANEIRNVVMQRLTTVHAALPPEPAAVGATPEDPAAAEAARIAAQGQLPPRASGPPVPGQLDAPPKRPVDRPGVQRPDRNEVDR
jgi:relaxase-like protein